MSRSEEWVTLWRANPTQADWIPHSLKERQLEDALLTWFQMFSYKISIRQSDFGMKRILLKSKRRCVTKTSRTGRQTTHLYFGSACGRSLTPDNNVVGSL